MLEPAVTENSVVSENKEVPIIREIIVVTLMSSLFVALLVLVASSFRTRAALQAEILALRHQLAVFQKNAPRRLRLRRCDRLCLPKSYPGRMPLKSAAFKKMKRGWANEAIGK